jgi:hypothetical protein
VFQHAVPASKGLASLNPQLKLEQIKCKTILPRTPGNKRLFAG